MRRTTVFIDEHTLARLQKAAQRSGTSSAALIREALSLFLDAPRAAIGMPSVSGQFASGRTDTAERADEFLWPDPHV